MWWNPSVVRVFVVLVFVVIFSLTYNPLTTEILIALDQQVNRSFVLLPTPVRPAPPCPPGSRPPAAQPPSPASSTARSVPAAPTVSIPSSRPGSRPHVRERSSASVSRLSS